MRRFSRREFLWGGVASVGALALSGRAYFTGGAGGNAITFLHWRGEDVQVFNGIIEKFQEEFPDIPVAQNVLPSDSYPAQAQATLFTGRGADVFTSFPGSQFVQLAGAGVFADLSDVEFGDRFEEKYIASGTEGFYETSEAGGPQLALPYQVVFNIPVYNTEIFEENGLEPPPDWDGFLELCETLKQNEITPIAFSGPTSGAQFINPMLMNNQPDEQIWQRVQDGETRVTEDWFVTTLSQIKELNDQEYFQEGALGSSQEGASALLAQGEAAMLALGSYQMAAIEKQNPEIRQDLLAPITVPASEKVWDGIYTSTFMLGINAKSEKQEQALRFVEFLTRPEIAAEYANGTGQLLALRDVDYGTEILQAQVPWLDKAVRFQSRFLITQESINQGLIDSVEDVLGGMEPEDAAEKLQAEVDRAVSS